MKSDGDQMAVQVREVSAMTGCEPLVSVCMITYNHERLIEQAVESVMMQMTDFPIELVIGEDCSTDGTRDIVIDLQRKYPDRIRLLLPERNLGMMTNSKKTFLSCRGKYIAILEGDDFWTDPMKLTKQVHILESDPKIHLCFHPVAITSDCRPVDYPIHPPRRLWKSEWETEDLLQVNPIPTCSVMLRRKTFPHLPPRFDGLAMADFPTWLFVSLSGTIVCIKEVMGTYRIHEGGTWSSKTLYAQMAAELAMWKVLKRDIKKPLHPILWKRRMLCYDSVFSHQYRVHAHDIAPELSMWAQSAIKADVVTATCV